MINRFIVRTYALILHQQNLLLSIETYKDRQLIKFPGGGVEFGEGLIDGLSRELNEELGCKISTYQLFYTPDQFVQSAFHDNDQIISIYYLIQLDSYEFNQVEHQVQWVHLKTKGEAIDFTFAQDLAVYRLLQKQFI